MKRKILLILLSLVLILPSAYVSADEITTVDEAVEEYKKLFDRDTLDWLLNMYDGESGGFYFSQSAKDNPDKYAPTIECINWAIGGLRGCGIVDGKAESIPLPVREKFVDFLRERRMDDGYYYDYYAPGNRLYTEAEDMKKGRDLSAARSILSICGVGEEELAKGSGSATLMSDSLSDKNLSDIQNEEEFSNWIRVKFPFTLTPYQDASTLAANKAYITEKGWDDTLTAYLVETQKDDGLWGDDRVEMWAKNNRINGALKNCAWFQKEGTSYPKLSEMVESVLYAFENYDMPSSLCESWNRLELIRCAFLSYDTIPSEIQNKIDENLLSMLKACLVEIENFKMTDGGYSMYKDGGTGLSQGFPVCEADKIESDMNAFAVIRDYIRTVHFLAGKGEPSFENSEDSEYFWAKILEKQNDYAKIEFTQNDVSVAEISSGELCVKTDIYSLDDANIMVVAAVYDGDKIEDVRLVRKEIKGGIEEQVECNSLWVPDNVSNEAYAKAAIFKDNLKPISKPRYAYMTGSGDMTLFEVEGARCDINTKKNIIYVESGDGESVKAEAEVVISSGGSYKKECFAEGYISEGDKYTVLTAKGEEKKVYTIKIEKALNTTYLSTFDAGYRTSTCPAINNEGDAGIFDIGGLSYVSIQSINGNNVLQIDKNDTGVQCNIHRYYPVEDSEKYVMEYKFNVISSSGDYLFHNYLFSEGITPNASTWNNSEYEEYREFYVDEGRLMISHTSFSKNNQIAMLHTDEWNSMKVVMRKTSSSSADYEVYINGSFAYSCTGDVKFGAGERVKMLMIEDYQTAKYKIHYDDIRFSY